MRQKHIYVKKQQRNITHRDLNDSLRLQLPTNAGELALTLAPARLRFK